MLLGKVRKVRKILSVFFKKVRYVQPAFFQPVFCESLLPVRTYCTGTPGTRCSTNGRIVFPFLEYLDQ